MKQVNMATWMQSKSVLVVSMKSKAFSMDKRPANHWGASGLPDDNDDDDPLWIKTDGSSAALIDSKADRWQSQLGCGWHVCLDDLDHHWITRLSWSLSWGHEDIFLKCLGQRGVSGCQGCQVGAFGWPAFGYFLCDLASLCICRYHP